MRTLGLCAAALAAAVIGFSGHASAQSAEAVDVARYQSLKQSDPATLALVLAAMHDMAFYVEESAPERVICASPAPLPTDEMIAMVDAELAQSSSPMVREYGSSDRLAFVLLNAMRAAAACE